MKKIDPRLLQSLELQNKHDKKQKKISPVMALDWGEKVCGIAWTPDGSVCLPYGTFPRTKITNEINKFIQEKSLQKIIIGLPISGDGGENHICQAIREFAEQEIKIPYEFCNERGSSQAIMTPKKDDRIDDLAAAQILERYLRQESLG